MQASLPSIEDALAGVLLDRVDLGEAAHVALRAGKLRAAGTRARPPRERRADDPRAEAEDVHVVVLDALPRRERVVAQSGADSGTLFAATDAPTPLPQTRMPRSQRSRGDGLRDARAKSG